MSELITQTNRAKGDQGMKRWIVLSVAALAIVGVSFFAGGVFEQSKKHEQDKTLYVMDESRAIGGESLKQGESIGETPDDSALKVSAPKEIFIENKWDSFSEMCQYLNSQPYIQSCHFSGGSLEYISSLVHRVLMDPPVISAETRDMYTLLSNASHIYRVLGTGDFAVVMAIMDHEYANVEDMMTCAWEYFFAGKGDVDLEGSYGYACFFLETLGGRSYLARRPDAVSIPVRYWCVRIIEKADMERMNPHGIDIQYHIDLLEKDIQGFTSLKYRQMYLETLSGLKVKK
jgi:hypothetical protein